jgi:hypothetical protein
LRGAGRGTIRNSEEASGLQQLVGRFHTGEQGRTVSKLPKKQAKATRLPETRVALAVQSNLAEALEEWDEF